MKEAGLPFLGGWQNFYAHGYCCSHTCIVIQRLQHIPGYPTPLRDWLGCAAFPLSAYIVLNIGATALPGNPAIFYKDFGYSDGLVILGKIDGSVEALPAPGSVSVTIWRLPAATSRASTATATRVA